MSQIGLSIREKIENASIDERSDMLNTMYDKWVINHDNKNKIIDKAIPEVFGYLQRAIKNFDLDPHNLQLGLFEKQKIICTAELAYLRMYFELQDQGSIEADIREAIKVKFNKTYRSIVDAENAIRSSLHLQSSMCETEIGLGDQLDITRYQPVDPTNNTAWQNLLLFLLENLFRRNLRRYDGNCYEKVYTPKGYDTHAWVPKCSLDEFIFQVVRKETHYEMWQCLTNSKDNVKGSVTHLKGYIGPEFEDITKDRNVFAFNNGIYITSVEKKKDNSISEDDSEDGQVEESDADDSKRVKKLDIDTDADADGEGSVQEPLYEDEWIPYGSKKIGSNVVSCKYFQMDFDDSTRPKKSDKMSTHRYNDPFNIIIDKCKNLRSIMTYQEWPEEVQRWLCILMGRQLYPLNKKDGWQIAPYLLGQAGTGKSTLLINVIKKFYEDVDIGIVSNNIEKKFGLSAFHDKFLFIAPEIKSNFSLEQAEFQSLISGEDMSVATKNEIAKTVKWEVPGSFAGNEVPGFSDNAGSVSRRLFVFLFNKKVKRGDTHLGRKLEKEIGHIIHACNRLYLEAVEKYGQEDVWTICPQYFKDSRDEMAESTNALTSFLKSDKVRIDPDLYVPESIFIESFNEHCKDLNITKPRWTTQYCLGPFSNFDIVRKRFNDKKGLTYPKENGSIRRGIYCLGVDVVTPIFTATSSDMDTVEI